MTRQPNTFSCPDFADRLLDFLESDTDDATRARIEAHARSCDDCGALLADLRRLRVQASTLPLLTPSRDLWTGIETRIGTPVIALRATGYGLRATGSVRWAWRGLIAAGVVAISAGAFRVMTK